MEATAKAPVSWSVEGVKEEKEAEEMELEEKDFKQELGITEGKCATP
jgi:hypothetical protein